MTKKTDQEISLYVKFLALYFMLLILGVMNIGSFGSVLRYVGLIPALFGIAHVIETGQLQMSPLSRYIYLFVAWAILSVIWSLNSTSSFSNAWSYFTFFLLIISVTWQTYNEREISLLKSALIWSSRISIIASLLFRSYADGRLVFEGVLSEDPNYLCAYYYFSLSNAVIVLCSGEPKWKKIFGSLELFLIAYLIIATGSRGGALGAIACAVVVLMMLQIRDKNSREARYRPFQILVVIYIAGILLSRISSSDMLERFTAEVIEESNGTGRYEIWEGTINAFWNSNLIRKFIGYGSGMATRVALLFDYPANVTHNAFLQILIELGIVGLFFYISYILKFVLYSFKSKDIFSLGVVFGMVVLSLSTSILTFKPYWNILIYILCLSFRREEAYVENKNQENNANNTC